MSICHDLCAPTFASNDHLATPTHRPQLQSTQKSPGGLEVNSGAFPIFRVCPPSQSACSSPVTHCLKQSRIVSTLAELDGSHACVAESHRPQSFRLPSLNTLPTLSNRVFCPLTMMDTIMRAVNAITTSPNMMSHPHQGITDPPSSQGGQRR